MYDPRFNLDGQNGPQVIPPAYGLAGLHGHHRHRRWLPTSPTGTATWRSPRWAGTAPSPSRAPGVSVTNGTDDRVSSKLPALQAYQLSIAAPAAPRAASIPPPPPAGRRSSPGPRTCSTCHSGADFTDGNTRLHPVSDALGEPEPVGVPSYASRSATKQYRTAPLKGAWQHPPYFHNGTAATLTDVVNAYNDRRSLGLSSGEVSDLVQYLKSL